MKAEVLLCTWSLLALKTTKWLFSGCGTGALECAASLRFFTLVIGVALPDNSPPCTLQEVESFDVCNYSVRQLEEYKLAPNPDAKKLDTLECILNDAKERLISAARKVLEMVDS